MLNRIIFLSALGYFVDIFDLALFSSLRSTSLKDLGLSDTELISKGVLLLNCQMAGLLIGGILFGYLGDRLGRVKNLYFSIFIYSLATLLNGFVQNWGQYALLRFVAGIGLAGELGIAVTLVVESMPVGKRGIGTTVLAGFGLSGGVFSALITQYFSWRQCYWMGGCLGFFLLFVRIGLQDSKLYLKISQTPNRGNPLLFIREPKRLWKLMKLVLVGIPILYVAGILMIFSPEIANQLRVRGGPVLASNAVLYSYIGISIGDFLSGLLSQYLQSRKKTVGLFLFALAAVIFYLLFGVNETVFVFYLKCFLIGICTGYWVVLITMGSESFGTNLRASATTILPNFIRGAVIPISWAFEGLSHEVGALNAARYLGVMVFILGTVTLFFLEDSFHKDLEYLEK